MDNANLSNILTAAALVLIAVGVGGGGFLALRQYAAAARRRARLAGGPAGPPLTQGGRASVVSGMVGGVRRLGDRIAIQDPAQVSVLRAKLMQAGYYSREAVAVYLGARAAAMVAAILGMVLILPWALGKGGPMGLVSGAGFAIVAILGPDKVLSARRSRREREFREGFPDLLDLLVASVEAGLSLDAAVSRVTEELERRYRRLAEQLRVLTLELRAGRARKEAWIAFADRLGIDEARSLATMLRQAEEMGTSLAQTLGIFSDEMRTKRMLRAEEKAMALPAKMMLPLILFIFPCLIGVLMLPAAYKISQALGR